MSNGVNNEIYLDYAATAPIHDFVLEHLISLYKSKLGNSTSIHQSGVKSSLILEKARLKIAKKLNCLSEEVYFTSGATESNNLILRSIFQMSQKSSRNEILISSIEHSSITKCVQSMQSSGLVFTEIPVDHNGYVKIDQLERLITEKTCLVSVAHANSEIGVIQNLKKIGDVCKKKNVLFHSDGAQAFCKVVTDMSDFNLDFYSISGHKIQAPKGIGAVYIRQNLILPSQMFGGGQESGLRSGTVAVELASAVAAAVDLYTPIALDHLKNLQNLLVQLLSEKFHNLRIHGSMDARLANQLNFGIPGTHGKKILQNLNQKNIFVSVGSACNSGKKEASRVLISIGLTEDQAYEAIRVSWGLQTTAAEIRSFVVAISEAVADCKSL